MDQPYLKLRRRWRSIGVLGTLWALVWISPAAEPPRTDAVPLESTNIHNLFRVTPRVFSGSQPEGDAAFAELARLGVKTIISVDGGQPDLEAARRHGLRYVHLPIGYAGIPTNRVVELTAAAGSLPSPFFVHCHHGKHRGPAAVAVMCLAEEGWDPKIAEQWLKQAGTAADYSGLYRAAREFHRPDPVLVASVGKLPEVALPSTTVAAMVEIDAHLEHLKLVQKAAWKTPPNHPDVSPSQEAVLLWEQLRELGRHPETAARPADYREQLAASEKAADQLRSLLSKPSSLDLPALEATMGSLLKSCSTCHKAYRN